MKIIFFNGPPRSGKDTAAQYLYEKYPWIGFERFAAPLKTAFAAMTESAIDDYHNVEHYEKTKEDVIPWLGVSFRTFQRNMSEDFMKPLYGKEIFGKLLIQRLRSSSGCHTIVIPDSGFVEEVRPVAEHVGLENIKLVRVHREGCDFSKDSRTYLHDVVPAEIDVYNDSTIEAFHEKIEALIK